MGTNCTHLLADTLTRQTLLKNFQRIKMCLCCGLRSTCTCMNTVLSVNNFYFHSSVDLINSSDLEIKEISNYPIFSSYLDNLLTLDVSSKLTTQLYDKCCDFSFFIVNLPNLCSDIPLSTPSGVQKPQSIRSAIPWFAYDQFLIEASCWQTNWCYKSFLCRHYYCVWSW